MRLKSYLRGIGIGILVTAAIFLVSGGGKSDSSLTDEQIKERARELGMTEQITLVEPTSTAGEVKALVKDDTVTEAPKAEPTKAADEKKAEVTKAADEKKAEVTKVADEKKAEPTKAADEKKAEPTKAVDEKKDETKPADEKKEEPVPEEIDSKVVIIVVNSGDSSDTVSRKLFEAGVVADAKEYDRYLMENGYDRTITVGNHKISVTASKEEIAKNLVSPTR